MFYINYMECKLGYNKKQMGWSFCFILTIWNVNDCSSGIFKFLNIRFILTIWNVNISDIQKNFKRKNSFYINYMECKSLESVSIKNLYPWFYINYMECK